MTANDEFILETLQNEGLIDADLAEQALELSQQHDMGVVEILEENGVLERSQILAAMARAFGMEMVKLKDIRSDIDPEVIAAIPPKVARDYKVIPISRDEMGIKVAISDPLNMDVIDNLRLILHDNVEPVVADADEIAELLDAYYGRGTEMESMLEELTQDTIEIAGIDTKEFTQDGEEVSEDDAPIIKLVSLLIIEAYRSRASDIHIEPMEKTLRVRYRIDGVLHEVENPPKRLQAAIITRLKIMSNMKIAEKRVPQDGRIKIPVMGKDLDLRVSAIPSTHGESIVMRLLDKDSLKLGLPELGFFADDQANFERMINLADGIILVTGPTGSGKTTTLYSCLNEINKPDRKIITVEDPVEYQLEGINQVNVRADIGLTFASALKAMLRQAPNIVMLGEIRDMETAEIAINASLTGHLVFSTLHTNDAPSAITRLVDIGVKPFLVASSLRGIMAQRLVRNICPECKEEVEPTSRDLMLLGPYADQVESATLYRGAGCSRCGDTGYKGRRGLFEIVVMNEELQRMIFDHAPATELRVKAREHGMRTLREDGLRKALAGITTLEEVFRVTMGDEE